MPTTPSQTDLPNEHIYQVSELVREAKLALEKKFRTLWVEGEVSNFSTPKSGHWYFTLKDAKAQLRCAMFRSQNQKLGFRPEDGLHLLVHCRIGLYEARGEFQAVVESMEVAGEGALRLAFEQLRDKLEKEKLFEEERKKEIPEFPNHIGVVTSATGAVIRDIFIVLARRYPMAQITLLPVSTQGNQAPADLIAALNLAAAFNDSRQKESERISVLIVGRGGGSLEDLQAFNDEAVARAIVACPIPIVTAVGHETDTTIADMVADKRAPTPSAAAELVSPDQQELRNLYLRIQADLAQSMSHNLRQRRQQLEQKKLRLRDPSRYLEDSAQRLDDLSARSRMAMLTLLANKGRHLESLKGKVQAANTGQILGELRLRLGHLQTRADAIIQERLSHWRQCLQANAAALGVLSPLNTLDRGYALVQHNTALITSVRQVLPGRQVSVFVKDGRLDCDVQGIEPGDSPVTKDPTAKKQ